MAVCHLILMLPVAALPLFWFLPWTIAGPLYGAASAAAGVVYYYAWKTGHRPVEIGRERLRGAEGEVLVPDPVLRVKVDGDSWQARSKDHLTTGDLVCVDRVDGLTLRVSKRTHGGLRPWKD